MSINTGAGSGGVAFVQGSTWGTAVAVGANRQIRVDSFDDSAGGRQELPREDIANANGSASDLGVESRAVKMSGSLYYGANCGELISYVFGTSGAPTNNTGSYTHTVTWDDTLNKFLTLVAGKRASQKPWEYASMKARRLVLRGSGAGRVEWEMELLGGALDKDSSTNTTTELAALTIPASTRPAIRLTDGLFRINAQTGATLASPTDDVQIVGFELAIERPLSEDFGTNTNTVLEPCEDGANRVTLSIDYRSYTSETFIDAWDTGSGGVPTEYKADLVFSSGVTPASGQELTWTLQFPRMHPLPSAAPIAGRERIAHRVTFKCLEASSAPSGMSGVTKPVHLLVEDEDSSAYLA